jgi:uncharacterized protein (TIGR02284 family)
MGSEKTFMAGSVDEVASTLNQLMQTCRDGEHGFASAAMAVEQPALRRLFESYSQQRAEFAAELELEVRRLAQDPIKSGHASAALHRSWLDIKAGIVGRSDKEVISECERGEVVALRNYAKALDSPLPQDLRLMVERQFTQVTEAHDQIRSLERSHSGTSEPGSHGSPSATLRG